jgi:hypothetical protein
MKVNDTYVDLHGDPISLASLDAAERRLVGQLRRRATTNPDWNEFDNYWTNSVPAFYVARGLPRKAVTGTIPWQIAQDLSGRLGIAAGHIAPPGPFDDLDDVVLMKFGSVRAFCKATGIPEDQLDGFMAGRADLSLRTLLKGLETIGYRLRLVPAVPVETVKQARQAGSAVGMRGTPMNDSVLLREATVQEIQLELIRRTKFNAFDGEQIYASLMKHRAYWQAVLLDQPGVANYQKPRHLLMMGLIKLRDLDDNIWNADKLFILTAKREQAVQLARIIEEEDWGGEKPIVYDDQEEIDSALGVGRQEYGLLSIWWD